MELQLRHTCILAGNGTIGKIDDETLNDSYQDMDINMNPKIMLCTFCMIEDKKERIGQFVCNGYSCCKKHFTGSESFTREDALITIKNNEYL
jgi:hypothetical protein